MLSHLLPTSQAVTTAPGSSHLNVAEGVSGLQTIMVNLYFVGHADRWVLVDAGMPMQAWRIFAEADRLFGAGARPEAVILTHGHMDHIGALKELLKQWDVPVYAHRLELPYLTGQSAYPPPDPTVGGGIMPRLSPLFAKGPFDFRPNVRALPEDGSVPGADGWRWIHTPGHAPGHVSLFRDSDRTLIAGDAFVTQRQESFVGIMTNHPKLHGPPMYFTPDWVSAKRSVQKLAELEPATAATGHGVPLAGEILTAELNALAAHFEQLAMPAKGRYINEPALTDENGVVYIPPKPPDPVPKIMIGLAAAALVAGSIVAAQQHRKRQKSSVLDWIDSKLR